MHNHFPFKDLFHFRVSIVTTNRNKIPYLIRWILFNQRQKANVNKNKKKKKILKFFQVSKSKSIMYYMNWQTLNTYKYPHISGNITLKRNEKEKQRKLNQNNNFTITAMASKKRISNRKKWNIKYIYKQQQQRI